MSRRVLLHLPAASNSLPTRSFQRTRRAPSLDSGRIPLPTTTALVATSVVPDSICLAAKSPRPETSERRISTGPTYSASSGGSPLNPASTHSETSKTPVFDWISSFRQRSIRLRRVAAPSGAVRRARRKQSAAAE